MFNTKLLHKDESGQTALETAIILIAFVVVASVFAFVILSAGSSSTEKSEAAIYSGLENVQSSMAVKGAVIATGASNALTKVSFTVALAGGGEPVDLDPANKKVVIAYRDADEVKNEVTWAVDFIGDDDGDMMLEEGELAEISIDMSSGFTSAPGSNSEFTFEVKPPTGAVLNITRTTPAAIDAVMELR
ncbi:MAG: archaellin/type IV pilin N-terminal domain-containing protein [Chloroflexota bacterium]|jgi:flagellin FlaB